MTALIWDDVDSKNYELGVDRGVFYPSDGPGVPWNGLLSVVENTNGADRSTSAKDGVTYLQNVAARDYQATVQAFSTPKEFSPCVGDLEVVPGFILTRQPRSRFGFSYRTMLADDYKIHIVYNARAVPTSRSYATNNDTPSPTNLEWKIDAIPEPVDGYRPSAHFVVNSQFVNFTAMAAIEDILYGTDEADPALPEIDDLVALITSTYPEFVFDDGSPTDSTTLIFDGGGVT